MADETSIPLPEPGLLRVGGAPYWRGMAGVMPITLTFATATAVVLVSSLALFGWQAVRVLTISIAVALLVESVFNALVGRSRSWSEGQALLIGLLFACTLPPMVHWRVVVIGSAVAVLVGQSLAGGVGNYLWHPVVLGRVLTQILFHEELMPKHWPILASGRFFWGDLSRSMPLPTLWSASTRIVPDSVEAWRVVRPADQLREVIPGVTGNGPSEAIGCLVRDTLPGWLDTLTGMAGGAIGEASVIAILIAGLLLLWRGFLRGSMVFGVVASAAVMAAVLPVRIQWESGFVTSYWLPGTAIYQGLPVGLAYVGYQLTAGGLVFVTILLASDPSSTPLTSRGHLIFGVVIGVMTILLRVVVGMPASAYWALLFANTLVPIINRMTRRRVWGT